MSDKNLQLDLVRLAKAHPSFRKHIVPLLRKYATGKKSASYPGFLTDAEIAYLEDQAPSPRSPADELAAAAARWDYNSPLGDPSVKKPTTPEEWSTHYGKIVMHAEMAVSRHRQAEKEYTKQAQRTRQFSKLFQYYTQKAASHKRAAAIAKATSRDYRKGVAYVKTHGKPLIGLAWTHLGS